MNPQSNLQKQEIKRQCGTLIWTLVGLWILTAIIKETFPIHSVYVLLALLFVVSSLLFSLTPIENYLTMLKRLDINRRNASLTHQKILFPYLKSAKSKYGKCITLGYSLLTATIFLLVNTTEWQTKFVKSTKYLFQGADAFHNYFLAPVYEEIFFRGALLLALNRLLSEFFNQKQVFYWSIYLSAIIFWIFHFPTSFDLWKAALSQGGLPLSPGPFMLGLVCAFIAQKDGSCVYAIILHVLANSCGELWGQIITNETLLRLFYSV